MFSIWEKGISKVIQERVLENAKDILRSIEILGALIRVHDMLNAFTE